MAGKFDPNQFVVTDAHRAAAEQHLPSGAQGSQGIQAGMAAGTVAPNDPNQQFNPANWLTGQNRGGTENGWNTAFLGGFYNAYSQATGAEQLSWFRDKKDGIALWDDPNGAGEGDPVRFGDVFSNGKKVENLYDSYGQSFADSVMATQLLSGEEQRRAAGSPRALKNAVAQRRAETSKNAADAWTQGDTNDSRYAKEQAAFQQAVKDEKASWDQPATDALTATGGAVGGALTLGSAGAAIGSVLFPGAGTLAGAIIGGAAGAVVGAVGAGLNRDEIQDQYARGEVKADLAAEEAKKLGNDPNAARLYANMETWGGTASELQKPLKQLHHGIWDADNQGDGESDFYKIDQTTGEKERPWWATATDTALGFVDSVALFATPVGRIAYQSTLLPMIGGQVGTLTTTGGTFDDSRGVFDRAFTNEDANGKETVSATSLLEGTAAIGGIAIDAVSSVTAFGLGKGAKAAATESGVITKETKGILRRKETGNDVIEQSGMRFVRNKNGEILDAKMLKSTWAVPSELVNAGYLRLSALSARAGGKTGYFSGDELFQAAQHVARRQSIYKSALINAQAEGVEEGVQEIFQQRSHGLFDEWDFQSIMDSAVAGAASGAGMTVGSRAFIPTAVIGEQRYLGKQGKALAEINGLFNALHSRDMTPDEQKAYLALPQEQQAKARQEAEYQTPVLQRLSKQVDKQGRQVVMESTEMTQAIIELGAQLGEAELKKANPGAEPLSIQTLGASVLRGDKLGKSLLKTQQELHEALEALVALPESETYQRATPELKAEIDRDLPEMQQLLSALLTSDSDPAKLSLDTLTKQFYEPNKTRQERADILGKIQKRLDSAFNVDGVSKFDPAVKRRKMNLAKVVSAGMVRMPADNQGSTHILGYHLMLEDSMPAVEGETKGLNDMGVYLPDALREATGGDFDGDKIKFLMHFWADDISYLNGRIGMHLLTDSASKQIALGATPLEEDLVPFASKHLLKELPNGAVQGELDKLQARIRHIYDPRPATAKTPPYTGIPGFSEAFEKNVIAGIRTGDVKAKQHFWNDIFGVAGMDNEVWDFAREHGWHVIGDVNSSIQQSLETIQGIMRKQDLTSLPLNTFFNTRPSDTIEGRSRASRAATASQTMSVLNAANDMFRIWGAGNYDEARSFSESTPIEWINMWDNMVAEYTLLTSGIPRPRVEQVTANHIKEQVRIGIERKRRELEQELGRSVQTAELWFMAVPELLGSNPYNPGETQGFGEVVSFPKWLLRQAVFSEVALYEGNIPADVAIRHQALLNLSDAEAIEEVFGGVASGMLFGLDAEVFGSSSLTFEQLKQKLLNANTETRAFMFQVLRNHNQYLRKTVEQGRGSLTAGHYDKSLPPITAYQAGVDTLFELVNKQISFNETADAYEQVGGSIGDSSRRTSENWYEALNYLHAAWGRDKTLNPRDEEQLGKWFDRINPSITKQLIKSLHPAVRSFAVNVQTGHLNKWFRDVLMEQDVKKSEALLVAHTQMITWRALAISPGKKAATREYDKLDSRFHRLMWRLSVEGQPSPTKLLELQDMLMSSTDIYETFAKINDPANGFRRDEPPFTPWVQDAGTMDSMVSLGQVTATQPWGDVQSEIAIFRQKLATITTQDEMMELDRSNFVGRLRNAWRTPAGSRGTEENTIVDNTQQLIKVMKVLQASVGPNSMRESISAMMFMWANASDKGKNVNWTGELGAMKMIQAFSSFATPEENLFDEVLAGDAATHATASNHLARPGEFMDAQGYTVKWEGLEMDNLIDLLENPANTDFVKKMLFPHVIESNPDGGTSLRPIASTKFSDIITGDAFKNPLFGEDAFSRATLASVINGMTPDNDMLRLVHLLALVRTGTAKDAILQSRDGDQRAAKAISDVGDVVMDLAALNDSEIVDPDQMWFTRHDGSRVRMYTQLDVVRENIREHMHRPQRGNAEVRKALTDMIDGINTRLMLEANNVRNIGPNPTADEQALSDWYLSAPAQIRELQAVVDNMDASTTAMGQILTYHELEPAPQKNATDEQWIEHNVQTLQGLQDDVVLTHGLASRAPWATPLLRYIDTAPIDPVTGLWELTKTDWEQLRSLVILSYLEEDIPGADTAHVMQRGGKMTPEALAFYDQENSWLIERVLGRTPKVMANGEREPLSVTAPILHAAHELNATFNQAAVRQLGPKEMTEQLKSTIFNHYQLGNLTRPVRQDLEQVNSRLSSAGALEGVSAGGLTPPNVRAAIQGTQYTDKTPEAKDLSEVRLHYLDPKSKNKKIHRFDLTDPDGFHWNLSSKELDGGLTIDISTIEIFDVSAPTVDVMSRLSTKGQRALSRLTRAHQLNEATINSNFQLPSQERLNRALELIAEDLSVPGGPKMNPGDFVIYAKAAHPRYLPEGAEWANNIFFEGAPPNGNAEVTSALAGGILSAGGIAQRTQVRAMSAAKKAASALARILHLSPRERELMQGGWETDLYGTMSRIARNLIDTKRISSTTSYTPDNDDANGFDPGMFPSIVKMLKLRTAIKVYNATGEYETTYTAEEFIRMQRDPKWDPTTFGRLEMVPLSMEAVNALMHSTSVTAVAAQKGFSGDVGNVTAWTGTFTAEHRKILPGLFTGETRELPNNVSRTTAVKAPLKGWRLDEARANTQDRALMVQTARAADIRKLRIINPTVIASQQKSMIRLQQALSEQVDQRALDAVIDPQGNQLLTSQSIFTGLTQRGMAGIMTTTGNDDMSIAHDLYFRPKQGAVQNEQLETTIYGKDALMQMKNDAFGISLNDPTIVHLDDLPLDTGWQRELEHVLDRLTGLGSTVVLVHKNSRGPQMTYAKAYLESLVTYTRQPFTFGTYVRTLPESTTATQRAIDEEWARTEVEDVSGHTFALVGSSFNMYENAAVTLRPDLAKMAGFFEVRSPETVGLYSPPTVVNRDSIVSRILAAKDALVQQSYEQDDDLRGYNETIKTLTKSTRPGDKVTLAAFQKKAKTREANIERGVLNGLARLEMLASDGGYPENHDLKFGDFFPYQAPSGHIMLARYGYAAPSASDISAALRDPAHGGIVIWKPKKDPNLTAVEGRIVRKWNDGASMRYELQGDLQVWHGKINFDGTAVKIVPGSAGTERNLDYPDIMPGVAAVYAVGTHDIIHKEGYEGLLRNHQTLFQALGIDFRGMLAKALFGTDDAAHRGAVEIQLEEIQRLLPKYPLNQMPQEMRRVRLATVVKEATRDAAAQGIPKAVIDRIVQATAQDIRSTPSPEDQLLQIVMSYLTYENAKPSHVLSAAGAGADGIRLAGQGSRRMPSMFTGELDMLPLDSPLRDSIEKLVNDSNLMPTVGKNGVSHGWRFNKDFTFQVTTEDGEWSENYVYLHWSRKTSAPTNARLDENAASGQSDSTYSQQLADITTANTGIKQIIHKDMPKVNAALKQTNLEPTETLGEMYQMLTGGLTEPKNYQKPPVYNQQSLKYFADNREAVKGLVQDLTLAGDKEALQEYHTARHDVAEHFGISSADESVFDAIVRSVTVKHAPTKRELKKMTPEQREHAFRVGEPSLTSALQALELIQRNMEAGRLPVELSAFPLMHVTTMIRLNKATQGSWDVYMVEGDPSSKSHDLRDWLVYQLALVQEARTEGWDPIFLPHADGMVRSYAQIPGVITEMPLSLSTSRQAELLAYDWESPSLSPHRSQVIANPATELRDGKIQIVTGSDRGAYINSPAARSLVGKRQAANIRYRAAQDMGVNGTTSLRDYRREGLSVAHDMSEQTALVRIFFKQRVALALLDPRIMASAPLETGVKALLNWTADVVVGDNVNLSKGYSKADRAAFKRAKKMGAQNPVAQAWFYDQLRIQQEDNARHGKYERALDKILKFAGRAQDQTYGLVSKRAIHEYLTSVLASVRLNEIDNTETAETLALQFIENPDYIKTRYPDYHRYALNRAIDVVASVKRTMPSMLADAFIDPFANSGRIGVQASTMVLLKGPMAFSTFAANNAIRITGMQGVNEVTAALLTGRKKGVINKFLRNVQSTISDRDVRQQEDEAYDFLDTIESIDLAQAVIKGNIQFNSLLIAGILAGGLDLGGEDEEDKRRRRAAKFAGTAFLYDPLAMENDFRNRDMIYLDNIPLLSEIFKPTGDPEGRSVAQMNFIAKQFLSPIIGIERFLDTGRPIELWAGFQEGVMAMPLISQMANSNAWSVYKEVMEQADRDVQLYGDDALPQTMGAISAVGWSLQRMFMESSFANMLYIGADEWDRDPYAKVDHDNKGVGVTNRDSTPQPLLGEFTVDGEEKYTAMKRNPIEGRIAAMAENRFGLAAIMSGWSALTGGDDSYFRQDMVARVRSYSREELTEEQVSALVDGLVNIDQAEGVIRSIWKGGFKPEDLHLEGFYMTTEMRTYLSEKIQEEIKQDLLDAGLTQYQANGVAYDAWTGDLTEGIPGIKDLIWSQGAFEGSISYHQSDRYQQLNTSYVQGPGGRWWATGVSRNAVENFFGIAPFQRLYDSKDTNLGLDGRRNTTDANAGLNTGERGLVKLDEDLTYKDEAAEAIKKLDDMLRGKLDKLLDQGNKNGKGWKNYGYGGKGWKNYGRRKGGGGGGGGGSFTRLNTPRGGDVPYANTIMGGGGGGGNPIIRRADINRQRADSERGRLKPWQ